ncbi:MAG: hypothetical protein KF861_20535, partial [Planctomycetaceae bacterium]|nr:hypothetical protein [Planctomycetaceae bacterium]
EVVIGANSAPIVDAHFGTTVAVHVTWTIPADTGTADWTIVRNGDRIEVLDAWSGVVAWERLADIDSITIVGAAGRVNKLTIDMTAGGVFSPSGGITFHGTDADDHLSVRLGRGNDQINIDSSSATINDLNLSWSNVAFLSLTAGDGVNHFVVSGQPVASHGVVELRGGSGDDTYDLATHNTRVRLVDGAGNDTLNFHRSSAGKWVRLAMDDGRWQVIDRLGNGIALEGTFENVTGTEYADTLIGNNAANRLIGLGGRDHLFGLGGDDVLIGGDGDDALHGGAGNDLLIGGAGRDLIQGQFGDDLLIGGATVFDGNPRTLAALQAEWTSARSYAVRIANLTNGSGSADRLNGDSFLDAATVVSDGAHSLLQGGAGRDWFVIGRGDTASDRRPDEILTVLGQTLPSPPPATPPSPPVVPPLPPVPPITKPGPPVVTPVPPKAPPAPSRPEEAPATVQRGKLPSLLARLTARRPARR